MDSDKTAIEIIRVGESEDLQQNKQKCKGLQRLSLMCIIIMFAESFDGVGVNVPPCPDFKQGFTDAVVARVD